MKNEKNWTGVNTQCQLLTLSFNRFETTVNFADSKLIKKTSQSMSVLKWPACWF